MIISQFCFFVHISLLIYIEDRLAWYRRAVGYYRTAVGYYRVIAQEILKSKNSDQRLFRTSKNLKISPITMENDKNEKRIIFFHQKLKDFHDFPDCLRSDNDVCIKCPPGSEDVRRCCDAEHKP